MISCVWTTFVAASGADYHAVESWIRTWHVYKSAAHTVCQHFATFLQTLSAIAVAHVRPGGSLSTPNCCSNELLMPCMSSGKGGGTQRGFGGFCPKIVSSLLFSSSIGILNGRGLDPLLMIAPCIAIIRLLRSRVKHVWTRKISLPPNQQNQILLEQ